MEIEEPSLDRIHFWKNTYIENILNKNSAISIFFRAYFPDINYVYLLSYTPEQGEDIFQLLTDKREIISLEVPRTKNAQSMITDKMALNQYRRQYHKGKLTNRLLDRIEKEFRKFNI